MKLKHRALALLLSLAIVLTFMPAMAFAEVPEGANTKKATELKYEGDLEYEVYDDGTYFNGFYTAGNKITVVWEDGTSSEFVCKQYEGKESNGETWTSTGYFPANEDPKFAVADDGGTYCNNEVWFERTVGQDGKITISYEYEYYKDTEDGGYSWETISTTVQGKEKVYFKPVSLEFIPAAGYTAYAMIGQKYLYQGDIGGNGNMLRLVGTDGTVREYVYGQDDDSWGFYYTDAEGKHYLYMDVVTLDKRVPKGTNTVTGKIAVESETGEMCTFPISINVNASTYYTEVQYKTYTYTGKKITPKVVVKYYNGKSMKTMPKSWYTCSPKKKSAIGGYEFKIKIKKKYQKKYGKYLWGWYEIVPKSPTIKSAKGSAGKVTVTWKKLSKSERKNVSGFIIEVSKTKSFKNNTRWEWVEKNTASSATIDWLEAGSYYVRVSAYKDIKKWGSVWSKPSKVKSATVQ